MAVQSTGNTHFIIIATDTREDLSPYIVVPGRVPAESGDDVFFKNVTDVDVVIEFDPASPFDVSHFDLKAGAGATHRISTADTGSYPYEIRCGAKGDLAYGSRPIIIVYDKIP